MTSIVGAALPLRFGMPDDERRRLTGGGDRRPPRERGGRRRGDPMDLFTYACIAMVVAVTAVYCVAMLRARPGDATPPALQGLLAIIPLTLLLAQRRGKDHNE